MDYKKSLQKAKSFAEIFQLVKEAVRGYTGNYQAGLLLGLSDLGSYENAYLGAFYSFDANTIVINKRPLNKIKKANPSLYNPYIFHVLLHEYIHSLGYHDEELTRKITFEICDRLLGGNHLATRLAKDITQFMPHFAYSNYGYFPRGEPQIRLVEGFDRGNLTYVS